MNGDAPQRPQKFKKEDMAGLIAAEVEQLLARLDPDLKRPAIISAAKLAGVAATSYVFLSLKRQAALTTDLNDIADKLDSFIAEIAGVTRQELLAQRAADGGTTKPSNSPMPILNPLSVVALHDWVGPSAGPTFLEENYGIARSTLHRWQRRNEAIALLAGGKRHVFPLAQFVDGRPANGIADVSEVIGHSRLTWYWLSRPCDELDGYLPIDLLKMDRVRDVVRAARTYAETVRLPEIGPK
ncbi:hypothetical protein CO731_04925 [Aminobacter sp. MSH1]|uniref:antitoxin Xre/MbcA/ParS-like domain-containing protein n=1 Tax=Aminobacter sp. MSH1 TaxID=374606 RepID=UPI000D3EB7D7|nr:hypothetical protein [Aminobacter sp. MSH1]AWC25428.1 hypothetical protein CO731_04925 [Aminobacter sp. MSH1]